MNQTMSIGILGAGRFGRAIGDRAARVGHIVKIATGRRAEGVGLVTETGGIGAQTVAQEQLRGSDLIVVAVPLHRYRTIDASVLQGHVVIDAMNYWPPVDGVMEEFEPGSTSQVIEDFLGNVKLVKTLNHIGYGDLEISSDPVGSAPRRALLVASDHQDAKQRAAAFIQSLGYDAVDAGPLSAGRDMENGTEIFRSRFTADEAQTLLERQRAPQRYSSREAR